MKTHRVEVMDLLIHIIEGIEREISCYTNMKDIEKVEELKILKGIVNDAHIKIFNL